LFARYVADKKMFNVVKLVVELAKSN